jgi:hypothetical protein
MGKIITIMMILTSLNAFSDSQFQVKLGIKNMNISSIGSSSVEYSQCVNDLIDENGAPVANEYSTFCNNQAIINLYSNAICNEIKLREDTSFDLLMSDYDCDSVFYEYNDPISELGINGAFFRNSYEEFQGLFLIEIEKVHGYIK